MFSTAVHKVKGRARANAIGNFAPTRKHTTPVPTRIKAPLPTIVRLRIA